jgi:GT2 family glycosyltransferase
MNNSKRDISVDQSRQLSVDFIIPYHANYLHVSKLVKSIFKTVASNSYRITIIDDCSLNIPFGSQLSTVKGINLIRQEKRKGFGACLNLGISESQNDVICVLHSDVCLYGVSWILNMIHSLDSLKNNDVVMVGAKSNNPGVEIDGLKEEKYNETNDFLIKEGEFLPLYCAAFYRSDLNLIGPFKEYFAGGEDVELSARLQHKGLNQAVCGKAWVNHSCLDSFSALKGKQDKLNNKASLVKLSNDIKKYGWKLD